MEAASLCGVRARAKGGAKGGAKRGANRGANGRVFSSSGGTGRRCVEERNKRM